MSKMQGMRRALVTGATGLLGSHLAKELVSRGIEVVALVKEREPHSIFESEHLEEKIDVIDGKLEDIAALEHAIVDTKVDTVFHLAAQALVEEGVKDPLGTFEANIRGTYNLLEVCRNTKAVERIVAASSDKAYGTSPTLPYTEDMPLRGEHPYDVSKSCMDLLCQAYAHTYNLPLCVVRCGNIYGPGDVHFSRLIPGIVRHIVEGKQPEIRSDGTFIRDYLYVEDVVDGYLKVAEAMDRLDVRGQVFNLGPNKPFTVIEVVNMILSVMGKKDLGLVIQNRVKDEIHDQYLSGAKAEKLLGWKPKHSLEEGLKKTIPWYETLLRV
ncbi:MAG TPA: NAD-dependent epimerase/dehydratase family protein [Candidatus Peribacterales bacterium]|nr:NAD-dependent epimerase/dehydratase family protein [Candidatus Peribacterales bacterium]